MASGFREYDQYDALGLAALVRRKEVTASELLEEAIARCERVNPTINAVITPMVDIARKLAKEQDLNLPDGVFAGVPFLLKDLLAAYKGVPMKSGSRFFADYVPDFDEEYTRRLKASGLNIFGQTATPEFGVTPSTEPELTGATRNPWNLEHSPGGSSGGGSAAVAAGIVPMASASDVVLSVFLPLAAVCLALNPRMAVCLQAPTFLKVGLAILLKTWCLKQCAIQLLRWMPCLVTTRVN